MKPVQAKLWNLRVQHVLFISDRHRGIAKLLRDNYPLIQYFYDIWHVSKSITKTLTKLAKRKIVKLLQSG